MMKTRIISGFPNTDYKRIGERIGTDISVKIRFYIRSLSVLPGVTLLFVVVVVAAFLSISLGIFNVIYGELRLAGEMSDSFRALYATDEAMEWLLYNDRNANGGVGVIPGCEGSGNCDYNGNLTTSAQNTCASVQLRRRGRTTAISAVGEYPCNGGEFAVRRALLAVYQK